MRSLLRRIGTDTRYLLTGFPLSVIAFCLALTGFAAGLGTVVVWLGVPILAATLMLARGFADIERRSLPQVLGYQVARPRYRRAPENAGWFRRMANPLTSGQSWLDLLHAIVNFPIAVVTFCIAVTWWAGTVLGLTAPIYGWIIASIPDNHGLAELLGFGDSALAEVILNTAIGAVFAITLPVVLRGAALVQAGLGRAMLTGVAELQERIDDLAEGRAAAVSAEANALRKLERDIHDGPQQRLVSLAMDLSRAQRQLKRDPQAVERMLSEAISSTRETLDELRALSRGIAPPVLTDRGLAPALAALAGRCTVPVELDIQVEGRFAAAVENTVYFVVAESLTNIAKHSHATVCTVTLSKTGGVLMLTIGDDGVGGAHVAKGHGLSGLADRLRAVDGELAVDSPVGGPTVIVAEVPCG
ncbi:histidine kinase [Planomonospora parontospora subsp. parontospora]|uniref:histidine kinase n=2 Tax=Planomonospora parontospora TaxID=58119 RepID=A0AA37BPK0_9ACTN|nr:sensor histidine kinase [Planomonospora parontospora]GGL00331.1 histidine kinase [Planomonospora parontospora]GII11132.1 histidine kinase [Planomonospora parontospora subsp. parontospora]